MRKTLCSVPLLCSLVFVAGCDDIATLQRQTMAEQTPANTQGSRQRSEPSAAAEGDRSRVADRALGAVADAGSDARVDLLDATGKRALARDSFLLAQTEYMGTMQSKLAALDRSIAALDAKTQRAAGQKHVDQYARLKKARAQRQVLAGSIKALETERAEAWDASRARTDREWSTLKALLDTR